MHCFRFFYLLIWSTSAESVHSDSSVWNECYFMYVSKGTWVVPGCTFENHWNYLKSQKSLNATSVKNDIVIVIESFQCVLYINQTISRHNPLAWIISVFSIASKALFPLPAKALTSLEPIRTRDRIVWLQVFSSLWMVRHMSKKFATFVLVSKPETQPARILSNRQQLGKRWEVGEVWGRTVNHLLSLFFPQRVILD